MKGYLNSLLLVVTVTSYVTAARSMEFTQHFDGAMRMDGNSTWISADGEITADTPAAFEAFLENALIFKRQAIVINSPGGSVVAGLKLGAIIRKRDFLTTVARTLKTGRSVMDGHISISKLAPGECASSCVFAFAGGIERYVADGSRVGSIKSRLISATCTRQRSSRSKNWIEALHFLKLRLGSRFHILLRWGSTPLSCL